MKALLSISLLLGVAAFALEDVADAHGGTYRGPGRPVAREWLRSDSASAAADSLLAQRPSTRAKAMWVQASSHSQSNVRPARSNTKTKALAQHQVQHQDQQFVRQLGNSLATVCETA